MCVCMCECVGVGSRGNSECSGVEFGGPYINQFHYHRDRDVLEFQLRATFRSGIRREKEEKKRGQGRENARFVPYDFDLAIFR